MADKDHESPFYGLMSALPKAGTVALIGLRPASHQPVVSVTEAVMEPGVGLIGDRFRGTETSKRQVTLIQKEHADAVQAFVGMAALDPLALRRNLVVSGLNLLALKGRVFRVGTALLEYTGPCHPCHKMEELLGPGGFNAMRGHGGITARVLEAGTVRIGDRVEAVGTFTPPEPLGRRRGPSAPG